MASTVNRPLYSDFEQLFSPSEHTVIAKYNDLTWPKQRPYMAKTTTLHGQNSQVGDRRRERVALRQMWTMTDDVAVPVIKTGKSTVHVAKASNELVLETLGIE